MNKVLNSEEFLSEASSIPMIPVFNHKDKDITLEVVRACYEGGVRLFEFTDRSKQAIDVFKHLLDKQSEYPEMVLGVGSILNVTQCQSYFDIGAGFMVAPIVDKEVADFCINQKISWSPGCGTLTELVTAERLGAKLIKVFPADVLGPKFIKGVLGPCPNLKLMPTGGVSPTEENLKSWFEAGVTCVGMGSQLILKKAITSGDYSEIKRLVKYSLEIISRYSSIKSNR